LPSIKIFYKKRFHKKDNLLQKIRSFSKNPIPILEKRFRRKGNLLQNKTALKEIDRTADRLYLKNLIIHYYYEKIY